MKMTFKVVFCGGLAVFFAVATVAVFTPVAVWNPPHDADRPPVHAQQELGRKLFFSNGCNYCHTQYVRNVDNAMGPMVRRRQLQLRQPDDPRLGADRSRPLVRRSQAERRSGRSTT